MRICSYVHIEDLPPVQNMNTNLKLEKIRRLVGQITDEQLRYVDSFVSDEIGLFMPVGGACFYARTPRHQHPAYMFVLNFDDLTRMRLGDKVIVAQPGRLSALSPFILHDELSSDLPPRYIAVFVDREYFDNELKHYPGKNDLSLHGEFYDVPAGLLPLLKRFMVEADAALPGKAAVLHGLSIEICHQLVRTILGIAPVNERVATRMEIDRVVQCLHDDPTKKITVKEMAEWACMSPSHFTRIFKAELGVSPAAYMLQIRLMLAKKMLAAGDKSITSVALDCGFGSVSHFSSSFSKRFNISPGMFRAQLNKAG